MKSYEVFDPSTGAKERLIKIRDMSEKLDWTGDWSVNSPKWTADMREHLGYSDTYKLGSQTFYMSFDDYLSYFNSTCIVKVHHGSKHQAPYVRETLRLSHGKESFALAKFQVPFTSERVYITIH